MAKINSGAAQGNLSDLEKVLRAVLVDLTTLKSFADSLKASLVGKGMLGKAGLAIGSTKPNVANVACSYMIAGVDYPLAANATGTALSGDNVPKNKYGAWALDIDAAGSITIVPAAANATGYASAALAGAGIPAMAAAKVRLGYATAINTGGVFDPGTTELDAVGVTATYVDASSLYNSIASCAALTLS